MSMYLTMWQAPDSIITALQTEPEEITTLLFPDIPKPPGLMARWFGRPKPVEPPQPKLKLPADAREFDFDKSWGGIHFLLTGTEMEGDPPLSFLCDWGDAIGEVDLEYGPARSFNHADVAEIQSELNKLDDESLRQRFAPEQMENVYPFTWQNDPIGELEWLMEYVAPMREFINNTVSKEYGLILYMS